MQNYQQQQQPMQQQQPQLPVSPMDINQTNWVNVANGNLPIHPQVSVHPNDQQYVLACAGSLINSVQGNAHKNPIRIFAFNYISQNKYNNPQFNGLVELLVAYTSLMVASGVQFAKALNDATEEVVIIYASELAKGFPALFDYDANSYNKIDNVIFTAQAVYANIDAYTQQRATGGGQQNINNGNNPNGWAGQQQPNNNPNNWAGQQQQPVNNNNPNGWGNYQYPNNVQQQNNHQPNNGNYAQPMVSNGGQSFFQTGPNTQQVDTGFSAGRNKTKTASTAPVKDSVVPEARNVKTQDNWVNEAATVVEKPKVVEKVNNRPFDRVVMENGDIAIPVHLTDIRMTSTIENPYSVIYDCVNNIKFIVIQPDGIVREEIVAMTEEMEYLAHELDATLSKASILPSERITVPNWEALGFVMSVEESDDIIGEIEVKEVKLDISTNPIVGLSKEHIKVLKTLEDMTKQDSTPGSINVFVEELVTPYILTDDVGSEVKDALLALGLHDDVSSWVDAVKAVLGMENAPSTILIDMVKKATDLINLYLKDAMKTTWVLESILDDWDDLATLFSEEYGPGGGGSIIWEKFKVAVSGKLISSTSNIIPEEHMETVLTTESIILGGDDKFSEGILYSVSSVIIELPLKASELGIELTNGGGSLLESRTPGLFNIINTVLLNKDVNIGNDKRVYIETTDNVRLEVIKGVLNNKYILLSLV